MKNRSFLFFALALTLCGCNPCRYYANRCAPVESRVDSVWNFDTTFIERIIRDTVQVVALPQENAANAVIYPDTARAETSLAYAWAYLNGQQLMLRLANKPQAPIPVPMVEQYTHHKTDAGHQTTITKKVIEYRTKPLVKFLAWCGGIALLLLLLYIALKIGRYFIKR